MNKNIIENILKLDFSREFMIDDLTGSSYTYERYFCCCKEIAANICNKTNKDVVIAIMENSIELSMLYFSMLFTDKRIAVIDPQKGNEEIEQIINEMSGIKIICGDTIPECCKSREIISFSDLLFEYKTDEKIKQNFIRTLSERKDNKPYLITFTSGTSGKAKGVEHSFENLCFTASALNSKVCADERYTLLHVMPMTYMAGILNSILYPFLIGARIIITKRFSIMSARNFWKTVIKYNCNLFWLSPSMLMMIDKLDRGQDGEMYCRENNTIFLIGTAPLTNETRQLFNKRYGVEVFASYGLSETLFVSVETNDSLIRADCNCVGEILEGVKYRLDKNGEMLISVPWMFIGYTNIETNEYFSKKYYKTGDLVCIKDNFLYVTGRSKDLIIKGGMNISPLMIEEVIQKIFGIIETSVVAVKDSKGEERILCVYTAIQKHGELTDLDSIIKRTVIQKLGKNYTIDYTWCLESIPRNINGKIDKNKIHQIWKKTAVID